MKVLFDSQKEAVKDFYSRTCQEEKKLLLI